jgi:serine/threonine-protein phosphatase 2A activator
VRRSHSSSSPWISRSPLLALPPELQGAETELLPYLLDSFGNPTRVDYGTGHETAFAFLLCALSRAGAFQPRDAPALVTRLFARHLRLARLLQTTYWLEPAGSHGAWGLDDYAFLPFLWGAAQLEGQQELRPACAFDDHALAAAGDEWLYLGALRFVRSVKRGALRETSPMLADIAALPSWARVGAGLARMYEGEVLDKLPIAQHFLFGSLLRWTGGKEEDAPG